MLNERICSRCGGNYTPSTARQQVCAKEHFKACKSCGESYPWAKRGVTCSSTCASTLRKLSAKEIKCAWCSKTFSSNNPNALYCKSPHFSDCAHCGEKFEIASIHKPSKTCSSSCASALTHTEEADEKRRITSLERFGTEHPFQNDGVKAKIQASLDASDNDFRFGSEKFKENFIEKYGVTNASQLEEVKAKKAATSLANYGVSNPMQFSEVRQQQREATITMHGKPPIDLANEAFLKKHGHNKGLWAHLKNLSDWDSFPDWARSEYNRTDRLLKIKEVAEYFNCKESSVRSRRVEFALYGIFESDPVSKKEQLFKEFIMERFPEINFIVNSRKIIGPKELDFYFPDYKLAIEISPTSTHAIDTEAFGGNSKKTKDYHLDKATACEELGIELITIFDWMPWTKVLSMIEHKLQGSERIYARKCKSHFIPKTYSKLSKDLKNFIDSSHVLGFDGRGASHYSYLTYKNEIVAVAAWGSPRTLSVKSLKKETLKDPSVMELVRLCFKPGLSITGGVSKLLKEFIRSYSASESSLKEIVTFSDYDLGWGKIYETLGFDLITKPSAQLIFAHPFLTVGNNDDERAFRVKNSSLHMAGADRLLSKVPGYSAIGRTCKCADEFHANADCLPTNTEAVIGAGLLSMWDCGYKKWKLEISENF